jgi:hypothetical protein
VVLRTEWTERRNDSVRDGTQSRCAKGFQGTAFDPERSSDLPHNSHCKAKSGHPGESLWPTTSGVGFHSSGLVSPDGSWPI